jgi:hypothetical protein
MSCPNCGHSSTDWKEGQPCPRCGAQLLKIEVSEGPVRVAAEFTAEGKTAGETTGIRHAADAGRSVSLDLDKETSGIVGSINAPARPGETGTKEVCERLLQRLNQEAGITKWDRCECVDDDKSEKDCVAHAIDDSAPLKIQVTRGVPGSTGIWKPASGTVEADYKFTFGEACRHIETAIQEKAGHYAPKEKENLLLAVDMLETPGHELEQITRRLDPAWIASLGFREIWLVGLTPSLCARLHTR